MALTEKQVKDLNNMNVAAQRAGLGNLLKGSEASGEVSEATTEKAGIVKQAKVVQYQLHKQAQLTAIALAERKIRLRRKWGYPPRRRIQFSVKIVLIIQRLPCVKAHALIGGQLTFALVSCNGFRRSVTVDAVNGNDKVRCPRVLSYI